MSNAKNDHLVYEDGSPGPSIESLEKMCVCGDRKAFLCDEEWGPDCDLGNNEKFVKGSDTNLEDLK